MAGFVQVLYEGHFVGTNSVVNPFGNTTAGNDIIVALYDLSSQSNTYTVSDGSNTYSQDAKFLGTGTNAVTVYRSHNTSAITTGSSISITVNNSATILVMIWEVNGLGSVALDKTHSATGTSTSPASGSSGTLSQPSEYVLGLFASFAISSPGFSTSIGTIEASVNAFSSPDEYTFFCADEVVSATTAVNYTATYIGSQTWLACVLTYEIAPTVARSFSSSPVVSTGFSRTLALRKAFTSTITPSNTFKYFNVIRNFFSTIVPSTIYSILLPTKVTGSITTTTAYSYSLTLPVNRYGYRHPDAPKGKRVFLVSGSDNRVRISNLQTWSGTLQTNANAACTVQLQDNTGSVVLSETNMTYDTQHANSWYYDIPAADIVNGNGPWTITVRAYTSGKALLNSTFIRTGVDNLPFIVNSMRSGMTLLVQLDGLTDGSGNPLNASNTTATIGIKSKSGAVLQAPTAMVVNTGEVTKSLGPTTLTVGTDPWNGTIIISDLSSNVHLTVLFTGTDANRV